ncbi:MAG: hypothetical protein ACYCY2_03495 [Acidithiobacillus ferriphilus]|jgi:hypothetical protein|uniref:Uncharacterized protein n=1 Tax=mine drainage metagenome TaxID=410659 RepID=E6QJK0_9ZZZZ
MVETEVSLLQALQDRISDRILALAQHALDLGMKLCCPGHSPPGWVGLRHHRQLPYG